MSGYHWFEVHCPYRRDDLRTAEAALRLEGAMNATCFRIEHRGALGKTSTIVFRTQSLDEARAWADHLLGVCQMFSHWYGDLG